MYKDIKRKPPSAKEIALVGVMAATLTCGKLVLSSLANVEVVTVLCALYGYVFGWCGIAAAFVFAFVEMFIYGIGSWVISYFIYWPLVAFVFLILRKNKIGGRIIPTVVALCLTVFFGILSSVIESIFRFGMTPNYFKNLLVYYLAGVPFYITQIVCNLVVFGALFPFLSRKMTEIRNMCRF